MELEKKVAYVMKYALTRGIIKVDGEVTEKGYFIYSTNFLEDATRDWVETEEEAKKAYIEKINQQKALIMKKVSKLQNMLEKEPLILDKTKK